MPTLPKSPCTAPGCSQLVTGGGKCAVHLAQVRKESDARRGTAYQRGYGPRWQAASRGFLRAHPLCQCPECDEGRLRILPSEVTDHIIPHRGDMKLFWDSKNWQAMSKVCHDKKTAREDGGFGR